MHLTCTNMPKEKVDIALRVSQSHIQLYFICPKNISDILSRRRNNTDAEMYLRFEETHQPERTNGRRLMVVSCMALIS